MKMADYILAVSFAASSVTIVSGAMAERCKLPAYFFFSACMGGIVYPLAAHWYAPFACLPFIWICACMHTYVRCMHIRAPNSALSGEHRAFSTTVACMCDACAACMQGVEQRRLASGQQPGQNFLECSGVHGLCGRHSGAFVGRCGRSRGRFRFGSPTRPFRN